MAVAWAALVLASAAAHPVIPERLPAAFENESDVSPRSIAECDALVRLLPRRLPPYMCYVRLAWATLDRGPALKRLRQHLARRPGDPRVQLSLGVLVDDQGGDSERLFRASAEGFAREGDAAGEGRARLFLQAVLCDAGRCGEAEAEMARAARIAETSDDLGVRQFLLYFQGLQAFHDGDLGKAGVLLERLRKELSPRGIWWLRHRVLDALGDVYSATGRHREALDAYASEVELLRPHAFFQALARHGVAAEAVRLAAAGEMPHEEAARLLSDALDAEVRVGARHYQGEGEFNTRVLLGLQLGATAEGIAQLERALALGVADGHPELQITAARLLSKLLVERDPAHPARPLRLAEESIDRARLTGRRPEVARGLLARAYVCWRSGDRSRAVRDALAALEALDELRERQPDEMVRARASAESATAYALVAGWLLDPAHGPADAGDLALSFSVMERLRARVLLDALRAVRSSPAAVPVRDERDALLARIARVQRRLLAPIEGAERDVLLASLASLERGDDELRDRIARAYPRLSAARAAPPALAEAQAALGPDEAMLTFQTWSPQGGPELPYQDGSSWVLLLTRDGARALRIPDSDFVARAVRMLSALIERRDGSETEGSVRLYRELLDAPLQLLPPGIRRLVIVPDGPLHRLPFDALREKIDAPQLGERFIISLAPSAALWLRWRNSRPAPAAVPLVAFADPDASAGHRPLPYGRAEAAFAVERLGRGSRLIEGAAASETLLKQLDVTRFGIVHFAAHASVDEDHPERSAVVLSAGAPEEDGLLQVREVAALDFSGRAVVLAACRSASGALLRGEGTLSLTRAFFQAGAHAVVGSLWTVRDDEGEAFFSAFYRHLSEGKPMGEAMALARRERIRAGAPAAAWAGLTLHGDGELSPVRPARAAPAAWTVVAVAAVLLIGGLLEAKRRAGRLMRKGGQAHESISHRPGDLRDGARARRRHP